MPYAGSASSSHQRSAYIDYRAYTCLAVKAVMRNALQNDAGAWLPMPQTRKRTAAAAPLA